MKKIKIATLYFKYPVSKVPSFSMDTIRWFRISEGFAERGYEVDILLNNGGGKKINENLSIIPYSKADWGKYHVIKTLFHCGFRVLREECSHHPFIISNLGSVVASEETPGVHFHDAKRLELCDIQTEISKRSRIVSILTEESLMLWKKEFKNPGNTVLVPTGVDSKIPSPSENPYKEFSERIAIYAGNIYGRDNTGEVTQKDINLMWQRRLNAIGRRLKEKKIRLCFIGEGDTEELDPAYVTYMGLVENERIWDYQFFADVGIVLAQGPQQHNESSKIYYYLRSGLPVVSEKPIPNNGLIEESGLGFISEYGNEEEFCDLVDQAANKKWDEAKAINYMLENHTWSKRVAIYDQIIRSEISR